jgi:hypothetical protein
MALYIRVELPRSSVGWASEIGTAIYAINEIGGTPTDSESWLGMSFAWKVYRARMLFPCGSVYRTAAFRPVCRCGNPCLLLVRRTTTFSSMNHQPRSIGSARSSGSWIDAHSLPYGRAKRTADRQEMASRTEDKHRCVRDLSLG